MALKTFVKISSINNLSDARYCSGMQVNLMGFSLEENNKNFVSPTKFSEITGWLSGLEFVGEFTHTHPDRILEILQEYPEIEYVEIQEEIFLKMLVNTKYRLILKQNLKDQEDLVQLIKKADSYRNFNVILLLSSETLKLNKGIIDQIKELSAYCEVLLGFGFHAETVMQVVEQTGIKGITLEGGDEIKPGLKDFEELADILESLETED
jgi:phosphoribosylanthranilate isomerase